MLGGALLVLAGVLPGVARASDAVRLVGTVGSLSGQDLVVDTRSGAHEHVMLTDQTQIVGRAPASLAAIVPQAYVGATAAPGPDGTLVASEVHIFPESQRGTGEGHRPMQGPAGTTMTNATVSAVAPAVSGTVTASPPAGAGRRLLLSYPGGTRTIVVPDGTPVVVVTPASRAELTAGAHIIVYAQRDTTGHPLAQRIAVGLHGSTPPL
ncbi:MAG: hypothetical protein JSR18_10575 [Proteobacteria bacterium]|nr:hypothetical protein [Pseudomonadota bacterium]